VRVGRPAVGTTLPHSSRMQATMVWAVSRAELRPGDLVSCSSPVSHVSGYIVNRQMVHASTPEQSVGGTVALRRIA
jgi:cell wall-associated NlpC family hydrolase